MKVIVLWIVFALLVSIQVYNCCAAEDPQDIVENAIRAQGGEEAVSKLQTMRIRISGFVFINQQSRVETVSMTDEEVWQMPGQFKSVCAMILNGGTYKQIEVVNKNVGWMSLNGRVNQLSGENLTEALERRYAESLDRLLDLRNKAFELSLVDPIKIDNKPAIGIKIASKGHRDVTLFFDQATWLLVKRVQQVRNDNGRLVSQEILFTNHKDFQGVKHWTRSIAICDGMKFIEGDVTEIRFLKEIDEKEFSKPTVASPNAPSPE